MDNHAMTLLIYDTDKANPLSGRVKNIDFDYQAEEYVSMTSQRPRKPWLVRWELLGPTGTILAVWTRKDQDGDFPDLSYRHPDYTGTWTLTPPKVYVAGSRHEPYTFKVLDALAVGNLVTSRWHNKPAGDRGHTVEERQAVTLANYEDIDKAEVLVVVPSPQEHLRGAHTEVGYAIGTRKPYVIVGKSGDLNAMTEHPLASYADLGNLQLAIARALA